MIFNKILKDQQIVNGNDKKFVDSAISKSKKDILKNRNILLGITGSIAAYKIPDLVRLYKKHESFIHVITTKNALNFVSKITLQTLSQNIVENNEWDENHYHFKHIHLLENIDIFVIAPITANTIAKIAHGICDNLLTTLCCALFNSQTSKLTKPVLLCPAMNCQMFANPIVKKNLNTLQKYGFEILAPESGSLACGYTGEGRLANIESILDHTCFILSKQ